MKNQISRKKKINHLIRNSVLSSLVAGLCIASFATTANANDTETRHGVISMKTITHQLSIEGGANYTLQNASGNGISNEAFAPFDLFISKSMWGGNVVYIEANTTPSKKSPTAGNQMENTTFDELDQVKAHENHQL